MAEDSGCGRQAHPAEGCAICTRRLGLQVDGVLVLREMGALVLIYRPSTIHSLKEGLAGLLFLSTPCLFFAMFGRDVAKNFGLSQWLFVIIWIAVPSYYAYHHLFTRREI